MPDTQPNTNIIKVANPPLEDNERTYLTSDVSSSGTTLTVLSTTGFPGTSDTDYYVIIEDYENEKAEIRKVDASETTTTTFKVDALTYSHGASTPVTFIPYNQVRFCGLSTSGGTKNTLATKNINVTEQYTEYTYTGTDYSIFVTAYYNSSDSTLSGYSEEINLTSFTRYSAKHIIEAAARKAQTKIDDNPMSELTWDIALEVLQDGIDEILTRKRRWSFLRTTDSSISTVANTAYISVPTDLSQVIFIKVNNRTLDHMSLLDYNLYTDETTITGDPTHFTEKNNKIYLYPTPPSAYTVVYDYYKNPATITNLSTEINVPFVTLLLYYCASQYAYIRGNDKRGDKNYVRFAQLLEQQVEEYTGMEQDGRGEMIERVSAFEEDNLY